MHPNQQELRGLIDSMSRDNRYDNPVAAADVLEEWGDSMLACESMLAADDWSQDRQPYTWLTEVLDILRSRFSAMEERGESCGIHGPL